MKRRDTAVYGALGLGVLQEGAGSIDGGSIQFAELAYFARGHHERIVHEFPQSRGEFVHAVLEFGIKRVLLPRLFVFVRQFEGLYRVFEQSQVCGVVQRFGAERRQDILCDDEIAVDHVA